MFFFSASSEYRKCCLTERDCARLTPQHLTMDLVLLLILPGPSSYNELGLVNSEAYISNVPSCARG